MLCSCVNTFLGIVSVVEKDIYHFFCHWRHWWIQVENKRTTQHHTGTDPGTEDLEVLNATVELFPNSNLYHIRVINKIRFLWRYMKHKLGLPYFIKSLIHLIRQLSMQILGYNMGGVSYRCVKDSNLVTPCIVSDKVCSISTITQTQLLIVCDLINNSSHWRPTSAS